MAPTQMGGESMSIRKTRPMISLRSNNVFRLKLIFFCILFLVIAYLPSPALAAETNTITQFGITWTFDKNYSFGQFANGDYWIRGPVTIIAINPPSTSTDGRIVHGSMINPNPARGLIQGYDSSMYDNYGPKWDSALNVARPNGRDLSASNPLIVPPGSSLVSTISRIPRVYDGAQRSWPCLLTAAVLTVVTAEPPPGSFRPSYCGPDKTIRYNKSSITAGTYDLFARLQPVSGTPILHKDILSNPGNYAETVERVFERPWLDHTGSWSGESYSAPFANMNNYGREISRDVGIAALTLNLNYTNSQKETLLIRMVQLGIDNYGVLTNGGQKNWTGEGGHGSGRLFPILLAGLVFNDQNMLSVGEKTLPNKGVYHFGEIDQTFYVEETSPGVYNYGYGGYTAADVGLPEWGQRHWWAIQWGDDNKSWNASYRACCTATSWGGSILASHIMGIKHLWHHDAIFDYQDRYMQVMQGNGYRQWDDFTERMWDTYRAMFGPVWPNKSTNSPPIANAGQNQTVTDNDNNGSEPVTLDGSGSFDTDGTIVSYVWTKNGSQLAAAAKATVTLPIGQHTITLTVTDNGGLTNSSTVTITVKSADTTAPSVVSVTPHRSSLEVVFNEGLNQLSAEDVNNYAIDNGIIITAALLNPQLNTVTLSTSLHRENVTYTLAVSNVRDTAGNPMPRTTINYQYDSGLIGYWKLDDVNGTAAKDSSDTGNTGTLINQPVWTAGKFGGALSLQSNNQAVEIATTGLTAKQGTVALWACPATFSGMTRFFFGHVTDNWSHRVQIYTDSTTGALGIGLGDTHKRHTNIYNLVVNTWYHIVLTWDGANYAVYVNGAEQAKGSYTGLSVLSAYADIGNTGYRSDRQEAFSGVIDEVRIYNHALTADEVLNLFANLPYLGFYPIGDKEVNEGSNLTFLVNTSDPNVEIFISNHNLPSEPNFTANTFSWTPTYDDAGIYQVTFTAPYGEIEDFETINITVNNVNRKPLIDPISNKSVDENATLIFDVNATDPDGDTISLRADNLPAGAVFANRRFQWTPGYDQAGVYVINFTATDGQLEDIKGVIVIVNNINRKPTLAEIGNKSTSENQTLPFAVSAVDPDGDVITYSARNLPVGAVFSTNTFTWTPTYDQSGIYQVTFVASDGQAEDSKTISITVNNTNRSPTLTSPGNKSVNEGSTLSFTVNASDPDGDTIVYLAQALPAGAAFSGNIFTWTPNYEQAGTYTVTFIASDGQAEDSKTITITVNDITAPPADIKDGLVGHWKLDEGTGTTAADSSGKGNTGSLINQPSWTTGKFDNAVGVKSIDQAVEIGTNGLSASQGTIALWVYPTAFAATTQFLFGHAASGWNNRIQIYTDNTSGVLSIGLGDKHKLATNIYNLALNTWQHIILTWNGTNYTVCVNGTVRAWGTYTGLSTLNSYADIGNTGYRSDRREAFNGIIDEVRIYNRALSADEALNLFRYYVNLPPPGINEGLIGYWKLDEASGTTAGDASGKGNIGYLINQPVWTVGKFGSAVSFKSIDQAVEIGTPGLSAHQGTITLWAYPAAFPSVAQFLFAHVAGGWNNRIQIYTDNTSGALGIGLGNKHKLATNIYTLSLNTWQHIALVWNGINYTVYVNGIERVKGTYTGLSVLSTYADIGNTGYRTDRREGFSGTIDEVRVYNRALTSAEILNLFSP